MVLKCKRRNSLQIKHPLVRSLHPARRKAGRDGTLRTVTLFVVSDSCFLAKRRYCQQIKPERHTKYQTDEHFTRGHRSGSVPGARKRKVGTHGPLTPPIRRASDSLGSRPLVLRNHSHLTCTAETNMTVYYCAMTKPKCSYTSGGRHRLLCCLRGVRLQKLNATVPGCLCRSSRCSFELPALRYA